LLQIFGIAEFLNIKQHQNRNRQDAYSTTLFIPLLSNTKIGTGKMPIPQSFSIHFIIKQRQAN